MVGLATFMIVSREDVPLYEADLGKGIEASSSAVAHSPGGGASPAGHPGAQAQKRDDAAARRTEVGAGRRFSLSHSLTSGSPFPL